MTDAPAAARKLAVVFGAAVRADGSASPALARRTGYALAAAEADPAVDLFLSGGVGAHPPSEAAVMADLLSGHVSGERMILDEVSDDTLQTVRAAATHARTNGYGAILTCTDAYHQPRVWMLFRIYGLASHPVRLAPRGSRQLLLKMWLREAAAIPYDFIAGLWAVWQDRRAHVIVSHTGDEP